MAEELLPGTSFTWLTKWPDEETAPAETSAARQGGLTRWLLYAVLYLMFTEQILAWDFQKWLWMLCPIVPAAHWLARRKK
jgi:hypothetical protein